MMPQLTVLINRFAALRGDSTPYSACPADNFWADYGSQ